MRNYKKSVSPNFHKISAKFPSLRMAANLHRFFKLFYKLESMAQSYSTVTIIMMVCTN